MFLSLWNFIKRKCRRKVKRKGLFLDSKRNVSDVVWMRYAGDIEWIVARTSYDFFELLDKIKPDVVSFSYDIRELCGNEEISGYDILKEMIDIYLYFIPLPECYFHTQNLDGKALMEREYQAALKHQKALTPHV